MKVTLRAFGELKLLIGSAEVEVPMEADEQTLVALLNREFPELSGKVFRVACNAKFVSGTTAFREGDVLALLPPFSGG